MEEERKDIPADKVLLQQEEDEDEQNGEILLKLDDDEEEDNQGNVECPKKDQNQPISQQLVFKQDEQLEDNETRNQQLIFVNEESTESMSTLPVFLQENSSSIIQLQQSLSNNRMIVSQVSEPEMLLDTVDYRLKMIELEMLSNKKPVEQLYMDNQSAESQFKLQFIAQDIDSKEICKNLLIFNHPKQLFEQLQTYPFLLSFRKIDQSHLEQCLFNHEDHFQKSYFHNKNKYHLIKSEDGEYHGQTNSYLVPEGYGIMYYANGDSYKGMFKNRRRHGQGKMIFLDGSSYSGNWEKDNQEGLGKHIDSDGEIFEGNFTDGNREGKGKLIWKNGYELEGIWRDGVAEGKSTLKVEGKTMPVIWKSGKIVEVNGRAIDHENQKTMRGAANTFPMCLIHIDMKKGSVDIEYE